MKNEEILLMEIYITEIQFNKTQILVRHVKN